MNVHGMLPFETKVADYVRNTGNHALYRSTPIFENEILVASGVLLEAKSVEDDGTGVMFCVYCYNVQPGIVINYATGDSHRDDVSESDQLLDPTASTAPEYIGNASSQNEGTQNLSTFFIRIRHSLKRSNRLCEQSFSGS